MLEFLQASYGDAIHIEEQHRHILIDGGPSFKCIESTVNEITKREEAIDLLIVTHYDDDHIGGILELFNRFADNIGDLVKSIWFNGTEWGFHDKGHFLSAGQGYALCELIERSGIPWKSDVGSRTTFELSAECRIEVLYGGPIVADVEDNYLSGKSADWECSLRDLDKSNVSDNDLDTSASNAASIVICLMMGGKTILLPGDSTPTVLKGILNGNKSDDGLCHFDLIKLPHHASCRNLSQELLSIIACDHFMVSTNGRKFCHPDKRAFLKVSRWAKHNSDTMFHFHLNYYEELWPLLNISSSDLNFYSFSFDGIRRW